MWRSRRGICTIHICYRDLTGLFVPFSAKHVPVKVTADLELGWRNRGRDGEKTITGHEDPATRADRRARDWRNMERADKRFGWWAKRNGTVF